MLNTVKAPDPLGNLLEQSLAEYSSNPFSVHKQKREIQEAIFLERISKWEAGYRPNRLSTIGDMTNGEKLAAVSEALSLWNLLDICTEFITADAASWAFMLRADGCEIRKALKMLDSYVHADLMEFVYENAWEPVAKRTMDSTYILKMWRTCESVVRHTVRKSLHPIIEHGRPETTIAEIAETMKTAVRDGGIVMIQRSDQTARLNTPNNAIVKPTRAEWLQARLTERGWNKHDVQRHDGCHHKTVQKILDGFTVRADVLERLVKALSKKWSAVNLAEIPHQS